MSSADNQKRLSFPRQNKKNILLSLLSSIETCKRPLHPRRRDPDVCLSQVCGRRLTGGWMILQISYSGHRYDGETVPEKSGIFCSSPNKVPEKNGNNCSTSSTTQRQIQNTVNRLRVPFGSVSFTFGTACPKTGHPLCHLR